MKNMMVSDERQKGFEEGYAKGREEGRNITASIEHELSAKCNSLAEENNVLRTRLEKAELEFTILSAQLDIVRLIFGRK